MAAVRRFGVPIDLLDNEILNARVADPTSPEGLANLRFVEAADTAVRDFATTEIAAEATAREGAVADVTAAFAAADTALRDTLRVEFSDADDALRALINDSSTADDLAAETAARIQGDDDLDTRLDQQAGDLTTEAQAREAADTALGGRIDTEAGARELGDTNLGTRIDGVDGQITGLRTDLTGETTARTAADDAITAAYQAADASLQADIDAIEANVGGAVRDIPLDEFADPTGPITMAGQRLFGLPAPVGGDDAATRAYADALDAATRAYADSLDAATRVLAESIRDRAGHTGTQLAASISDFDERVRTSSLDQFLAAAGDLALGGNRITGLAEPAANTDAATKNYVDLARQGIILHEPVRYAVPIMSYFPTDAVEGDRGLILTPQDQPAGLYTFTGGAWVAADDVTRDGSTVWVMEGDNGDRLFSQTAPADALEETWLQVGGVDTYTAGSGLSLDSGAFSVNNGMGLTTQDGDLAVDTSVVVRKVTGEIAGGSAVESIGHYLGTRNVLVRLWETATGEEVELGVVHDTDDTVAVYFPEAPAAGEYSYVVVG